MGEYIHLCESKTRYNFECIQYGIDDDFLELSANDEYCVKVNICPFCGYRSKNACSTKTE